MEALSKVIPIAVLVFVVSSMLAVGLSLTVKQILAPLRDARLVTLALLANFVLMPISAFRYFKARATGYVSWRRSPAAGHSSRRAIPSQTGIGRRRQPRLCSGSDGPAHGADSWLICRSCCRCCWRVCRWTH